MYILNGVDFRDFEVTLVVWLRFWMDHVGVVDGMVRYRPGGGSLSRVGGVDRCSYTPPLHPYYHWAITTTSSTKPTASRQAYHNEQVRQTNQCMLIKTGSPSF